MHYKPPKAAATLLPSALRLDCDKRDARGGIIFKDFATFRPTLRPMDVIQAGSFGGCGLLHACIRSQRTSAVVLCAGGYMACGSMQQ